MKFTICVADVFNPVVVIIVCAPVFGIVNNVLLPSECRERELNYSAPLFATIRRRIDKDLPESIPGYEYI
jgi:DNA-directed RNA polymerase beta subunit